MRLAKQIIRALQQAVPRVFATFTNTDLMYAREQRVCRLALNQKFVGFATKVAIYMNWEQTKLSFVQGEILAKKRSPGPLSNPRMNTF